MGDVQNTFLKRKNDHGSKSDPYFQYFYLQIFIVFKLLQSFDHMKI